MRNSVQAALQARPLYLSSHFKSQSSCNITKHIASWSVQQRAADRLIKGLHCWRRKSLYWMSSSDGCFAATSPNTEPSPDWDLFSYPLWRACWCSTHWSQELKRINIPLLCTTTATSIELEMQHYDFPKTGLPSYLSLEVDALETCSQRQSYWLHHFKSFSLVWQDSVTGA